MKRILILGLGTLLFFGVGGILIIEFLQDNRFVDVLLDGWSIELQLLVGLTAGLISAGIALFIITRKFFQKERTFYYNMISKLGLNLPAILFISLCAGIGEEIFFRAGIQPFLGVWLTSILFVLLHGYLNPRNPRITIYGSVMVFIIAGFGYLFEHVGLISVMTAHAVFDMVLFLKIQGSISNS
ncbi:CPBP family intramembrane glutamic endopeptidase [Cytophagaceae bacterium ABcell3]|nr:CPBP family intramembrane glutamic endopeptidase [Cytophagaceae bacterium ABcell3]